MMTDLVNDTTRQDQLLGQRFEGYEFKAQLGKGAFGVVYLARHPRLNRDVAVKYLETKSEEDAQAIGGEVSILEQLSHPRIVRIEDHFPKDNFHFIMLQYVSGGSLRHQLENLPDRRLDMRTIMFLTEQIAAALDYIHAQGILHLDLKPENILLESTPGNDAPNFFLTDFGIARLAEKQVEGIAGTPPYMAPEQFGLDAGDKIDRRADIYALGTILYELVVGFTPFRKRALLDIAYQHRSETPKLPSSIVDVPPGVEQVILRTLAKNPDDRFESASAVFNALQDAARTQTVPLPGAVGSGAQRLNQLANQYAQAVEVQSIRSVALVSDLALGLLGPDGSEREYKFSKTPIIGGRDAQVDLRLEGDPQVSRQHFKLDLDGSGRLTVTDLESRNHTYLDGRALVPNQPYLWSPEQSVTVRGFLLRQASKVAAKPLHSEASFGQLVGLLNQVQEQNRQPRVAMLVTPEVIRVRAGRAEYLKVTVKPQYTPGAMYELKVLDVPGGIDHSWLTLPAPKAIAAGESHAFDMMLTPPQVKAGTYEMYIGVVTDNPDIAEAGQVVKVVVEPSVKFNVSLKPTPVMHRRFLPRYAELTIENKSNIAETFNLDVTAHQLLRVTPAVNQVSIAQDKDRRVRVRLAPQRGAKAVGHLWYTVAVRAQSTNDQRDAAGAYQFSTGSGFRLSLFQLVTIVLLIALAAFVIFRLVNNVPPDQIVQELLGYFQQIRNELQRIAQGAPS
jgi:serine/threonine protein kinase